MIISVSSGKGGTGKTTIAVNLALSMEDEVQFFDCDVEEPNASIFFKVRFLSSVKFNVPVPEINEAKCDFCGKCAEICIYHALAVLKDKVILFSELCHSCGGCILICPKDAIQEKERPVGVIERGMVFNPIYEKEFEFQQGILNVGEAMASPLTRALKKSINKNKICIIDSPPGTSCPMVESVKGSDFCILVTEPTPFGIYDMKMALEVVRALKIPAGCVINRSEGEDELVEKFCQKENLLLLGKIPLDRKIARLYSEGVPFIQKMPEYQDFFKGVYKKIMREVIK